MANDAANGIHSRILPTSADFACTTGRMEFDVPPTNGMWTTRQWTFLTSILLPQEGLQQSIERPGRNWMAECLVLSGL